MKGVPLLLLLSLLLIFVMLLAPGMHGGVFFWLFLMLGLFLLFNVLTASNGDRQVYGGLHKPNDINEDDSSKFDTLTGDVMEIAGRKNKSGIIAYEGSLRMSSTEAVERLTASLELLNREFFLEDIGDGEVRLVIIPPGVSTNKVASVPRKSRYGVHWALFIATLLTTTWAGAAHQGVNLLKDPGQFGVGLPYALGLMLILGAHEMGHYLTAKRFRMEVSPPYFIPVPFALGTFGAFISLRTLPVNRKNLFDVAIAGPLAGFIVAVPALLIGLPLSTLAPAEAGVGMMGGGASLGSSLMLATLAKLSMEADLSVAHYVVLHPLAFAGWLGLLLTALNLLPIGQLDGGHIAQALFGARRARGISSVAMLGLFLLALFVWPGLLFFAILVFLIAGSTGMPPRDDVTPLSLPRTILGCLAFLLLLLIVIPLPHGLYESFGLHCPYV